MQLHEFRLGSRIALTNDATGSNLPGNGWAFVQSVDYGADTERVGAPYADVTAAVRKDGYFAWTVED